MSSLQKLNKSITRSPLFYVGDKFKLLPQLLEIFPDNTHRFIEPFTGGGSVAMNVKCNEFLLNDIDPNIVRIHELLRISASNPEEFHVHVNELIRKYGFSRSHLEDIVPAALKKEFKKTYYARYNDKAYRQLRSDYNQENEKDPYKLYLLLIYGFNRMIRFNSKGEFNVPVGNVDYNSNVVKSLDEYFSWASTSKLLWSNKDYIEFMESIQFETDDFVYMDPPYLITFSEYNKLWNPEKEMQMLNLLDSLNDQGIRFAISNVTHYKGRINTVFLEWSKKYKSFKIKSNYISYHDNSIKEFEEVLVTNY